MDAGNISNPEFAIMVFTKLTIFWANLDYGGVVNEEYSKTVKRFVEKAKQASLQIKGNANARSSLYFITGASHHGLKEYHSARYYSLKQLNLFITESSFCRKILKFNCSIVYQGRITNN